MGACCPQKKKTASQVHRAQRSFVNIAGLRTIQESQQNIPYIVALVKSGEQ